MDLHAFLNPKVVWKKFRSIDMSLDSSPAYSGSEQLSYSATGAATEIFTESKISRFKLKYC